MKKAIAFFIGAVLAAQTASAAYLTWQVWINDNGEAFEATEYTAHLVAARSQTWDGYHRGQDGETHENYWFQTVGSTTVAETDDGTGVFSDAVTANLANYSSGYYFFIELWAGDHVAYVSNNKIGTSYAELPGLVGSMSVPTVGGTAFQMTTATQVPEPATAGLLLIGLGLAGLRRKVCR